MFKRILIANRGEIAIRVMCSAKELGVETVAVFHSVDKDALHVRYADYAIELSGETPKSAYLDINQIIAVAQKLDCEAIHPGYGFLSENANFSQSCQDAGIKFIGPNAKSIELMGSKTGARELMKAAGVPIVPGYNSKAKSDQEAYQIAEKIGYPILLKAASGGGGKGMRLVESSEDLIESLNSASAEAARSFGDDTVYMEKYIVNPKHIEIQILADEYGNIIHLGERDCSIQRRHQKVVEEAPSSVLTNELREQMGLVAVNAAKACDYVNAGTIEFLLDIHNNFYFLEMNTRLQVEHPVTEIVTGLDLAKEQIKIAAGYKLSLTQDDVKISGHAVECRIYAEDPLNNFLPDIGVIEYYRNPSGRGVRVDGGVETGSEVGLHFDPMLAKLITWGRDRNDALDKMSTALDNYRIYGFANIIPFLKAVVNDPIFRNEYFDTGYIPNHFEFEKLNEDKNSDVDELAALALYNFITTRKEKMTGSTEPKANRWMLNNIEKRRLV